MNALDFDFQSLRSAMPIAARHFFASCRARAPHETFYGLAVCPDDDVMSFYWMAATVESLDRSARAWLTKTSGTHPETNYTLDFALNLFRYDVSNWHYTEVLPLASDLSRAGQALDELWRSFEARYPNEDERFEIDGAFRSLCLNAIADGLLDYDATGEIDRFAVRDDFIILVYDPDPSFPEEIRKIARRLNPPSAFGPFDRQYHQ